MFGMYWWFFVRQSQSVEPETEPTQQTETTEATPQVPKAIDLQPTIQAWVARQSATYSIVVYDPLAKTTNGSHLPDKQLFAASLYKLFVAYLALMDFQSGAQNPQEVILAGQTRKQCVDKMIRSSDSPCGETMMADMGPDRLKARLQAMDITQTDFRAITTTAQDNARILQYLIEGRHLNQENTAFLRDALLKQDQMYRDGLAKGAPGATVYSKVGWNEQYNYHDVGIMKLSDGREFVVAILGQGSGRSTPIAEFSKTIYDALMR